ncbi:glucose dehydrogenase [FAD, quinone]-like [Uloborus diversus]|uniref:glucose dehydrogenase [FAD, quinone]-like n=1 Tax=Uloborus diversus TaxID=327109 RepID=UPI002409623C|nr:glucose dehydrogenase [FAD, quinone]-like [Uloborus diversus]XP_054715803.1 glucose dehydrogenase [FAD, quinone]-like [Uloborus diversus]XP_054715804.1 glucose dehydrogenase [FAD, quinone]-like [Uloborus diversus]XP_054715805.1 glucose dehydrogenase [FAD, quinone]-like [Uloborus diversus]XP_054715806.1 glucose dehydrogenase [FAD, quinone]-like [Uloborus diversus]XP_054715807.1 glucose dehydrogenase [FAD, quinone]-like [Uloborus diversus]XP_054715808.1 glucose dehydrogenase [FAD, quinone]-l
MGYELSAPIQKFQDALKEDDNIMEYINNRTGPLALPEGIHFVGFLNSLETNPVSDNPDVSIYITHFASSIPIDNLNLNSEVLEFFRPYRETNTISCQMSNLYTKSIGTVTLNSRNPYEQPLVDLNVYSDVQDAEDLVGALKVCRNIMSTPEIRRLGVRPFNQLLPGCQQHTDDDESYLRCYVRNIVMEGAHVTGTAKMGSAQDPTTVVDPELRVKNVEGLRVIDASVTPNVPWGNTYIPTAMVAEKASDMIKATLLRGKR